MMKTTSLLFLALTAITTHATADQDDFPYAEPVATLTIKQDLKIAAGEEEYRFGEFAGEHNGSKKGCSIEVTKKSDADRILKAGKVLILGGVLDSDEEYSYTTWAVTNVAGIEAVYCQNDEQNNLPKLSEFLNIDSEKVQIELK